MPIKLKPEIVAAIKNDVKLKLKIAAAIQRTSNTLNSYLDSNDPQLTTLECLDTITRHYETPLSELLTRPLTNQLLLQ